MLEDFLVLSKLVLYSRGQLCRWGSCEPIDYSLFPLTCTPSPHTHHTQSNWDEICEKFDDMKLKEDLLRGIYAYG